MVHTKTCNDVLCTDLIQITGSSYRIQVLFHLSMHTDFTLITQTIRWHGLQSVCVLQIFPPFLRIFISGYVSLDIRSNNEKPDQAVQLIMLKKIVVLWGMSLTNINFSGNQIAIYICIVTALSWLPDLSALFFDGGMLGRIFRYPNTHLC